MTSTSHSGGFKVEGRRRQIVHQSLCVSSSLRYQGREGWAPASYLKKADIQSQKQSAGAAAFASTNDLDGFSKHQQNNAARENRENSQKENRLSFFSDNKSEGIHLSSD